MGKSTQKKATNPTQKKKRKARAQFRPSFRARSVFSFALAIDRLEMIREGLSSDEQESEEIGISFLQCIRSLSHSIEMLSKAVLFQLSPHLISKELKVLDSIDAGLESTGDTAGALVSLSRALKLANNSKLKSEDIGRWKGIFNSRNDAEHGEFHIKNFDEEFHKIVYVVLLTIQLYNGHFKAGNLAAEAEEFADENTKEVITRIERETSAAFKKVELQAAKKKRDGKSFTTCLACFYELALISPDQKSYCCLWCKDEGKQFLCSIPGCGAEYWSPASEPAEDCGGFHGGFNFAQLTMKSLSSEINALNSWPKTMSGWTNMGIVGVGKGGLVTSAPPAKKKTTGKKAKEEDEP